MFDFDFAGDGGVRKNTLWSFYTPLLEFHSGSATHASCLASLSKNAFPFPQVASVDL